MTAAATVALARPAPPNPGSPPSPQPEVDERVAAHQEPPPAAPPEPEPPPPPPPAPPDKAEVLRSSVLSALAGSGARTVAVTLEIEGLGRVIDHHGSTGLVPASTQKLYTASAVMARLGGDMRYRTAVARSGDLLPDGTLKGHLVLVAGGDPYLSTAELDALGAAVAAAGVRVVEGDLYVDDSRYDRSRTAPGWKPTYMPRQVGPLSAMVVDGNQWSDDPSFLAEPALGNLKLFRTSLAAAGVTVTGPDRLGNPGANVPVAEHFSPPLAELVARMLRESGNLPAELMIKELGLTSGNPSTAGGLEVMARTISDLGLAAPASADGSGLSLDNRSATRDQTELLKRLDGTPLGGILRESLPVTCGGPEPYWLNRRLCETPAAGRVAAKTGFLSGVRSLAGYATTGSGRRVWFSLNLLEYPDSSRAWAAIDRALVAIATFDG